MSPNGIPIAMAPITPVYFGDGRPNDAGEADFGSSRFPPSPRTIQGVVRTALLRSVEDLDLGATADRERIQRLVGPPDRLPAGWQISGPWPAEWQEGNDGEAHQVAPWFPCPGWLAVERSGAPAFRALHEVNADGGGSGARLRMDVDAREVRGLLHGGGGFARRWLSPPDVLRVLRGEVPREPAESLPPFVAREPHTSLQLDPERRVAEEGMLYTLDYYRFRHDSGIMMRFEGMPPAPLDSSALISGVSSLGRKNRVVRMLRVTSWDTAFQSVLDGSHIPQRVEEGDRFFLWATTPVGASDPLDPGIGNLAHEGARLELLSAAVGPREPIGGFSLVRQQGTVSRAYLPAGSAWLVAVTGGTDAAARRALLVGIHDTCCLGDDSAERSFGFGHALVARIPIGWRHR